MTQEEFRRAIVERLELDLIGPGADDEVLLDRPTDRYMTAILYPQQSENRDEEDDNFRTGDAGAKGAAAEVEDAVSLITTLKPSSAGVSFAVSCAGADPLVQLRIVCGTYKAVTPDVGEAKREFHRQHHDVSLKGVQLALSATKIDLGTEGLPGLEVYVQVAPWEGSKRTVTAALVNRNVRGDTRTESEERSFFQVALSVTPSDGTSLVPRPSRRKALDEDGQASELIYRHAREMATGHTCAAAWDMEADEFASEVRTSWMPEGIVHATDTAGGKIFASLQVGASRLSADWLGKASPKDLCAALSELVDCYQDWIVGESEKAAKLPVHFQDQAKLHLDACKQAAKRMKGGIALIASADSNVITAFQMAQKAMWTQFQWEGGASAALVWRPFQLGFQLLVLASLAERDHDDRDVMDLLWFPTGGGKTEAYLALTAFILFLRRLRADDRDSGAGVAVIMRYTLRLLTIQQFQRASRMVCACEDIRRRDPKKRLGADPLSIGLWVGNSATPGTVKKARSPGKGDTGTQRQLTECPCCAGRLEWDFPEVGRSRVQCVGKNQCAIREIDPRLPVWTIDEEIYREAPSLLIGTVDKFAQIVRKPATGRIFGCHTSWSSPDLIIQDELHLISGPLGSMTGLYETAIDELCQHKGVKSKIVGSTATIRRAHAQIRDLFDRKGFQFPPPALDASNSAFAVETLEKPGRLYVGISTAGRSAKYAVQAVSASLLQAATLHGPMDKERDPYWTLVGYFNSLRELGGSLVLMQDDVPYAVAQYANRHGETPRELQPPVELTSRVPSEAILEMLDELTISCEKEECHDILLASNMISVGMDIPRLGLMLMVGQPKTISEYIQATSRVGRRSPGLVVALYNANRVRDRAHFESFATWHQTLYREVEATSVTPFASRAQDRALHAIIVALVRHMVPSMLSDPPTLSAASAKAAEKLVESVERRVGRVDAREQGKVGERLRKLLLEWEDEEDLVKYWDDYGKKKSLLLSAEQHAASDRSSQDANGIPWATPNSMREVEAGTPFYLRYKLKQGDE